MPPQATTDAASILNVTLLPLNVSDQPVNIFCLPYGGGSVTAYLGLAQQLSGHARVFGLEDNAGQYTEQAAQLKPIGAGLVVAPNLARLLRRLGVLDAFVERAVQLDVGWEFRRWKDRAVLSAEDLATSCERLRGAHLHGASR